MGAMNLLVSPDGMSATWLHPLDLLSGEFPQYSGWINATDMSDAEFEALVTRLQAASREA